MSVAEALQRVPGVTVTRFPYGGASPDFPAPEGRGNLIRGLGFVRSEFNGRDAFSANGGRALDWSSIPPELVGAIDVYKNQSADLIEGGIGGTINLRTLQPFDREGHILAVTADETYADLGEEWAPSYSLVAGNRWDTDSAGEFGIARLVLELEAEFDDQRLAARCADSAHRSDGFRSVGARTSSLAYRPVRSKPMFPASSCEPTHVERDRTSYYLAAQWQKETVRATLNYARVENQIDSLEHTTEWFPDHDGGPRVTMTDLTFNNDWSTPESPPAAARPDSPPPPAIAKS